MLKKILDIAGMKHLNPVLVEYWDDIIWNFALVGVGVYSDLSGFILFGFANALINFSASIYTYKTQKKDPFFDILSGVVVLVTAILTSIFFMGKSLFLVIFLIAVSIVVFYVLCKVIKKTYFKNSSINK